MKNVEIKDYSDDQLKLKIEEESQTLTKLRFAHAVSSVENPMRIKHTRRDIARLHTELSSRNLSAKAAEPNVNQ